ncbi:hypothetical protein HPB50_024808 [Hyalomma asiaticum]|uniref:Uncharacterized protein n=1 Tax=Hyalomma asiaticum TaxID=266040 RepID=A0ACB7T8Y0_HYAAI|nr:hypothetical protein HPB50_024808 [Hyalomma asiaticum]
MPMGTTVAFTQLLLKYGYVGKTTYRPCGTILRNNLRREWRRHILRSAEATVLPMEEAWPDQISADSPEDLQMLYAAAKELVDSESSFGLLLSSKSSKALFPNRSSQDQRVVTVEQLLFFPASGEEARWLTYWQRQRLRWWRQFSRRPWAFQLEQTGSQESQVVHAESGPLERLWSREHLVTSVGLAPFQAAVATSGGLASLRPLAQLLQRQLQGTLAVYSNPSLGSSAPLDDQLSRFDEMGVVAVVILDETTLKTGVAHVRHRDTGLKYSVTGGGGKSRNDGLRDPPPPL